MVRPSSVATAIFIFGFSMGDPCSCRSGLAHLGTTGAEAQELNDVSGDEKSMFTRQLTLKLADKFHLLVDKIFIFEDAFASGADEVMMMGRLAGVFRQFVAASVIANVESAYNAHLLEDIERSVDRREPDPRIGPVDETIDLFRREMVRGRTECIDDQAARSGEPPAGGPKAVFPCSWR